jgi:hypothetical protein
MAIPTPLTPPQLDTFRVLGLRSNLASVEVLGQAMGSPIDSVRLAALQTLISRGGDRDMETILEWIDHCNDAELPLLVAHTQKLLDPIEAGLASRDSLTQQRSLCAIAKLQIASQFHHLVRVAQSAQDPQQIVAAELVVTLAIALGKKARRSQSISTDPLREQLLFDLSRSMSLYHEHKMTQVFEAWLCALHWDDESFKSLFHSERRDGETKVAMKILKHSHRTEIIQLLVGILWSKNPSIEALQMLGERRDHSTTIQLANTVTRFGVTPLVCKNMREKVPIHVLENFDFSSQSNPIELRCRLMQLLAIADVSPDKLLGSINALLMEDDPLAEATCASSIRSLRSLKPEIIMMVLSDCFDTPDLEPYEPPPWKSELKATLERLLQLYPLQPPAVRNSIEFAFSDFRCEEMAEHLDDWPESHLAAYGKIIRIAERGYIDILERDSQSQSAVKRARTLRIIRLMGASEELLEIVSDSLSDRNESVRIEAIYAIAGGRNRSEAIGLLKPLLSDEDNGVKVAADLVLSQLVK